MEIHLAPHSTAITLDCTTQGVGGSESSQAYNFPIDLTDVTPTAVPTGGQLSATQTYTAPYCHTTRCRRAARGWRCLALVALLTLMVALLARRLVLLALLTRLPIPQTDTTTELGSTEGALPGNRMKSRFSLSPKVASGEPGEATRSTPSSLPLGGRTIWLKTGSCE